MVLEDVTEYEITPEGKKVGACPNAALAAICMPADACARGRGVAVRAAAALGHRLFRSLGNVQRSVIKPLPGMAGRPEAALLTAEQRAGVPTMPTRWFRCPRVHPPSAPS